MTKRAPEGPEQVGEPSAASPEQREVGDAARATAAGRKPYQRPTVQKRRSVRQATLVSGSGSSGVGSSAAP